MRKIQYFLSKKLTVLLCFITVFAIDAWAQVPTQQQINEMVPGGVSPTMMTKSGFENFFKDNNQKKSTGADKNKENPEIKRRLENKILEKDSTQNDNFKRYNY